MVRSAITYPAYWTRRWFISRQNEEDSVRAILRCISARANFSANLAMRRAPGSSGPAPPGRIRDQATAPRTPPQPRPRSQRDENLRVTATFRPKVTPRAAGLRWAGCNAFRISEIARRSPRECGVLTSGTHLRSRVGPRARDRACVKEVAAHSMRQESFLQRRGTRS